MSEATKLYDALAKAQGEFPIIPKNSKVDVYSKPPERKFLYSYSYADLTAIITATKPALAKYGLSFTQGALLDGRGLITTLFHSSGEKIDTGYVPYEFHKETDMKVLVGQMTYLKRISLSAALGVSSEEDVDAADDENAISRETPTKSVIPGEKPKNSAPQTKAEANPYPTTPKTAVELLAELNEVAKKKKLNEDQYNKAILRVIGRAVVDTDLSAEELVKVIKYVSAFK